MPDGAKSNAEKAIKSAKNVYFFAFLKKLGLLCDENIVKYQVIIGYN